MSSTPTVRHLTDAEEEVWDDARGRISFRTPIGDGVTETTDLCSGVALVEPGGWLSLHRHEAPEIYQVVTGIGVVTLDGQEHQVRAGSAAYIPSDHEHGIRNTGDTPLEFVYVYRADSIEDIEYVWSQNTDDDALR
ncbi:cupin domain-containing protein [Curtobacterium sp. MCBD17_021]|uniref:cupin domain-containing protein n=1 Tax=Curtobacterium sp. MCBD17_021 TaxID=2175665 RepID=UPI000DAA293E|nr:cupin domain-containing protein [Curtobacterium sp. MCBD17_021]PZE65051.1 cupin domain-containing protein [Curtobacterium sp. MCBD17_021]